MLTKVKVRKQPKFDSCLNETIQKAKSHYESNGKNDWQLYCPFCGAPLYETNRRERLETLDEHVSCCDVSMKSVYKCSAHCEESKTFLWNYNGESYSETCNSKEEFNEIWDKNRKIEKRLPNQSADAIGSFFFGQNVIDEFLTNNKESKLFSLPWNKRHQFWVERFYTADHFGKILHYMPVFRFRKYSDDMCSYLPGNCLIEQISMFLYEIKSNHKCIMKDPSDERALKRLYGYGGFLRLNKWNKIETLWYSKLVPLIYGKLFGVEYEVDKNKGERV